jgi:hypothetical protein
MRWLKRKKHAKTDPADDDGARRKAPPPAEVAKLRARLTNEGINFKH